MLHILKERIDEGPRGRLGPGAGGSGGDDEGVTVAIAVVFGRIRRRNARGPRPHEGLDVGRQLRRGGREGYGGPAGELPAARNTLRPAKQLPVAKTLLAGRRTLVAVRVRAVAPEASPAAVMAWFRRGIQHVYAGHCSGRGCEGGVGYQGSPT